MERGRSVTLIGYLISGNPIVDTMGTMNITGNVVPTIWYRTMLKDKGKPYLLAIAILADNVYWYRQTEARDQNSGQITGWKKDSPRTSCGRVTNIMQNSSGSQRKL